MDESTPPKHLREKAREAIHTLLFSTIISLIILLIIQKYVSVILLYIGVTLFLSNIIYVIVTDWKPKGQIPIDGKAVIISGCDTGFGHLLALKLDKLGFQVFAGCLFPNGADAKDLKKNASEKLHVIPMDVTKDEDMKIAVSYVRNNLHDNKLWAVVCNAGMNDGGEGNWTDVKTFSKIIDVNTMGVVRMTKAFLPEICKSKGRVVVVASSAGRFTYPGMVPYAMSKSAVISFCEGLRSEMGYKFGIEVTTIEPWWYRTNITEENRIISYMRKTWEQAPDVIKDMYPANYIEKYISCAKKNLEFLSSNRPCSEVVSCMEEAITAEHPKYVYAPGSLSLKLSYWLISRLQKPLSDFLVTFFSPGLWDYKANNTNGHKKY